MKKRILLLSIVLAIALAGCASGPNETEIYNSVDAYFKGRSSVDYSFTSLSLCRYTEISTLEIIARGEKQKDIFDVPYWPIMLHIQGTCMWGDEVKSFGGDVEFIFGKDPYGVWVTQPR